MMNLTEETNQNLSNNTNNIYSTIQWNQGPPHYSPWGHSPNSPPASLVTFSAPVQMEQNQTNFPENMNNQVIGSTNSFGHYGAKPLLHCKRKANIEFSIPNKQHITEEKMAQHMSRLHISSETHLDQVSSEIEDTTTRQKRLYVCEEMRRLQTENILPTALLGRLERPCMAVMLWQPPAKIPELISQPETSNAVSNAMVQAGQASSSHGSHGSQIFQRVSLEEDENDNSSGTVNLNNMEMDS